MTLRTYARTYVLVRVRSSGHAPLTRSTDVQTKSVRRRLKVVSSSLASVPTLDLGIFHALLNIDWRASKKHQPAHPTMINSDATTTSVTSAMRSALSPANLSEAGAFAKERTAEFQRNLHDGSWSLRFLALLGALAMITIAILGFLHDVLMFKWISAIFEIYIFILGIVMIILEYGRSLSFFSKLEATLYKHALFVKYVWGRGVLYFIAGTLTIALDHLVALIVGGYVCLVGILFILVGRSTAKKLANARRSAVSPEQLQEKFVIADLDGKGALSKEQFGRLITDDLGLDLTRREVESAFLQLDCESRGRVSYESVLKWWKDDADMGDYEMV